MAATVDSSSGFVTTSLGPLALERLSRRADGHFPEAAPLALLDAALVDVEFSLRAEHPADDDLPLDPDHDVAPSLLTAHLIVSRCSELRSLLGLYAAALRRRFHFKHDCTPFVPF
jgi:hypothetical protein